MDNKSEDERRTDFLVKFVLCGAMAAGGLALIYGGVSYFRTERGTDAYIGLFMGVGFGVLLLRGAWKGARQ